MTTGEVIALIKAFAGSGGGGGGSSALVIESQVNYDNETGTLPMTAKQLYDAVMAGQTIIYKEAITIENEYDGVPVTETNTYCATLVGAYSYYATDGETEQTTYGLNFSDQQFNDEYQADDYPSHSIR